MKEKVLKFLKESKKVLLIIAGVVATLIAVVTSTQEAIEVIPSEVDSVQVVCDSIPVDSISGK